MKKNRKQKNISQIKNIGDVFLLSEYLTEIQKGNKEQRSTSKSLNNNHYCVWDIGRFTNDEFTYR